MKNRKRRGRGEGEEREKGRNDEDKRPAQDVVSQSLTSQRMKIGSP